MISLSVRSPFPAWLCHILCGTQPCCLLQPSVYLEPRLFLVGDAVVEAETLILTDLLPGHLFLDVWALLASWLPESWVSCGWAHLVSTEPCFVALGAVCFNTYAFPTLVGLFYPLKHGAILLQICAVPCHCQPDHTWAAAPGTTPSGNWSTFYPPGWGWSLAEPSFSHSCLPTPPIPASLLSGSTPAALSRLMALRPFTSLCAFQPWSAVTSHWALFMTSHSLPNY